MRRFTPRRLEGGSWSRERPQLLIAGGTKEGERRGPSLLRRRPRLSGRRREGRTAGAVRRRRGRKRLRLHRAPPVGRNPPRGRGLSSRKRRAFVAGASGTETTRSGERGPIAIEEENRGVYASATTQLAVVKAVAATSFFSHALTTTCFSFKVSAFKEVQLFNLFMPRWPSTCWTQVFCFLGVSQFHGKCTVPYGPRRFSHGGGLLRWFHRAHVVTL